MKNLYLFFGVFFILSTIHAKSSSDLQTMLLFLASKNDSVENMEDLLNAVPLGESTRNELLTVIKKPKNLRTSKIEFDSKKSQLLIGATKISFTKIYDGFVELNGKLLQIPKNGSAKEFYITVDRFLSEKNVLRSLFFESAYAENNQQSMVAQVSTVILSADHYIELCKNNNKSSTGDILVCPVFNDANILMQMYRSEFPMSIKCREGVPDNIKTQKRMISFFSEKSEGSESRMMVAKEVGKKICAVRDPLSIQISGNVYLESNSTMSTNQCLQLMRSLTSCCANEDECLKEYSLMVDDEKVRELYNKKQKNGPTKPLMWNAPSRGAR